MLEKIPKKPVFLSEFSLKLLCIYLFPAPETPLNFALMKHLLIKKNYFGDNVSIQNSCMEALTHMYGGKIVHSLFRQHFDRIIDRCENFPMAALIYGRDCPECSHSSRLSKIMSCTFCLNTRMFIL